MHYATSNRPNTGQRAYQGVTNRLIEKWFADRNGIKPDSSKTVNLDLISPFLYTGPGAGTDSNGQYSKFGLQGIKGADTTGSYYITGTSGSTGVVYSGPIDHAMTTSGSGSGTWTAMNVPEAFAASATSIYGVANLPGSDVQLVGSYVSSIPDSTGNYPRIGFVYAGPITATPNPSAFQSYQGRDPATGQMATFTYLHSVDGGLVVGNYDFLGDGNPAGNAFIFDPVTGSQTPIRYPDTDKTHTAYGIWFNGGNNYTIAGGVGLNGIGEGLDGQPIGQAALIDYNRQNGQFNAYKTYSFDERSILPEAMQNASLITHFEGIYSDNAGRYILPATISTTDRNLSVGATATVYRQANGTFSDASWKVFDIPATGISTNDSVFGDANVGAVIYGGATGASNYAGLLI